MFEKLKNQLDKKIENIFFQKKCIALYKSFQIKNKRQQKN